METKTSAVRREILKSLIDRYGNKPKNIFVQKAKEAGAYQNFVDDNEVYDLAKKFADYHKLPFGFVEKEKELSKEEILKIEIVDNIESKEEIDHFFVSLQKEHDILSKKLLALNKLIETYKL